MRTVFLSSLLLVSGFSQAADAPMPPAQAMGVVVSATPIAIKNPPVCLPPARQKATLLVPAPPRPCTTPQPPPVLTCRVIYTYQGMRYSTITLGCPAIGSMIEVRPEDRPSR